MNKIWEFVEIINKEFIFISDYRKYLIKTISKKYTIDEFYEIETTLNDMFWTLRHKLAPIWLNPSISDTSYNSLPLPPLNTPLHPSLSICTYQKYDDNRDIDEIISNYSSNTFYRSFINKLIIIDKPNKIIMTKKMEGASDIFSKNYFNLLTMYILRNKKLYTKIISSPLKIKELNITLPTHYYQYDYPFPNLNFCTYYFGTEEERKERIKKLYYEMGSKDQWFSLL